MFKLVKEEILYGYKPFKYFRISLHKSNEPCNWENILSPKKKCSNSVAILFFIQKLLFYFMYLKTSYAQKHSPL